MSSRELVKIRPKWDWNTVNRLIDRREFSLKSDQNGIEIGVRLKLQLASTELKSDQNGIEMEWGGLLWMITRQLKSDQNGIEITWNHSIYMVKLTLKSDQNGIEMAKYSKQAYKPT